ncbi:unnamed protein product [Blepharisma stoltei]|uniref:Uncharacterized protein n=1 Tax=Blepharisma stoltei TaxID=1481888 RepID=A0AAU9JQB1_9CILI|nr:unnamed protein product [Blepharisma stoltei]
MPINKSHINAAIEWYNKVMKKNTKDQVSLNTILRNFKEEGLSVILNRFLDETGKTWEENIEILEKKGILKSETSSENENQFLLQILLKLYYQYHETSHLHTKSLSISATSKNKLQLRSARKISIDIPKTKNIVVCPKGSFSQYICRKDPMSYNMKSLSELTLGASSQRSLISAVDSQTRSESPISAASDPVISKKKSQKLVQMEKLSQLQERKLMWIADARTKTEAENIDASFLQSRKRSKSAVQVDRILLYLLKPRTICISKGDFVKKPFIVNLVPNELKYSYKNEEYYFEWKDVSSLKLSGWIDARQINNTVKSGLDVVLEINEENRKEKMTLHCSNSEQASKYELGIKRVLKSDSLATKM